MDNNVNLWSNPTPNDILTPYNDIDFYISTNRQIGIEGKKAVLDIWVFGIFTVGRYLKINDINFLVANEINTEGTAILSIGPTRTEQADEVEAAMKRNYYVSTHYTITRKVSAGVIPTVVLTAKEYGDIWTINVDTNDSKMKFTNTIGLSTRSRVNYQIIGEVIYTENRGESSQADKTLVRLIQTPHLIKPTGSTTGKDTFTTFSFSEALKDIAISIAPFDYPMGINKILQAITRFFARFADEYEGQSKGVVNSDYYDLINFVYKPRENQKISDYNPQITSAITKYLTEQRSREIKASEMDWLYFLLPAWSPNEYVKAFSICITSPNKIEVFGLQLTGVEQSCEILFNSSLFFSKQGNANFFYDFDFGSFINPTNAITNITEGTGKWEFSYLTDNKRRVVSGLLSNIIPMDIRRKVEFTEPISFLGDEAANDLLIFLITIDVPDNGVALSAGFAITPLIETESGTGYTPTAIKTYDKNQGYGEFTLYKIVRIDSAAAIGVDWFISLLVDNGSNGTGIIIKRVKVLKTLNSPDVIINNIKKYFARSFVYEGEMGGTTVQSFVNALGENTIEIDSGAVNNSMLNFSENIYYSVELDKLCGKPRIIYRNKMGAYDFVRMDSLSKGTSKETREVSIRQIPVQGSAWERSKATWAVEGSNIYSCSKRARTDEERNCLMSMIDSADVYIDLGDSKYRAIVLIGDSYETFRKSLKPILNIEFIYANEEAVKKY